MICLSTTRAGVARFFAVDTNVPAKLIRCNYHLTTNTWLAIMVSPSVDEVHGYICNISRFQRLRKSPGCDGPANEIIAAMDYADLGGLAQLGATIDQLIFTGKDMVEHEVRFKSGEWHKLGRV